MVRLSVRSGAARGRAIEVRGDVVRIGRAPGNDLVLDDAHVSGEHARILIRAPAARPPAPHPPPRGRWPRRAPPTPTRRPPPPGGGDTSPSTRPPASRRHS